ncbi:hypothetical protein ACA910_005959 [Epithemia clementina (nom. ined.)]
MTSSFRYPPQLLHSFTESQWLPATEEQQTSSLDRLEAEEQARVQLLKRKVLPEHIPDPIGVDDTKKFTLTAQQQSAASSAESAAALFGPPAMIAPVVAVVNKNTSSAVVVSSQPPTTTTTAAAAAAAAPLFWQKYSHQQQEAAATAARIQQQQEQQPQHQVTRRNTQREKPTPTFLSPNSSTRISLNYGERLRRYSAARCGQRKSTIPNNETTAPAFEDKNTSSISVVVSDMDRGGGGGVVVVPAFYNPTIRASSVTTRSKLPLGAAATSAKCSASSFRTATTAGVATSTKLGGATPMAPVTRGATLDTPPESSGRKTSSSLMSFSPDEDTTFDDRYLEDDDDDDDDEDMVED